MPKHKSGISTSTKQLEHLNQLKYQIQKEDSNTHGHMLLEDMDRNMPVAARAPKSDVVDSLCWKAERRTIPARRVSRASSREGRP
jgi:hypothetical protein